MRMGLGVLSWNGWLDVPSQSVHEGATLQMLVANLRDPRTLHAHPLSQDLPLSNKHGIPLDEIRVDHLNG